LTYCLNFLFNFFLILFLESMDIGKNLIRCCQLNIYYLDLIQKIYFLIEKDKILER